MSNSPTPGSGAGDHRQTCSVIMPCFRMGTYVRAALDSVAAQTHRDWEVIVVDDCGPEDGTRDAVVEFAERHPQHRVEFVRHDRNRGVSVARRTGVELARGEYLAFLDPDDMYLPEKLARHVSVLSAQPEVVLVHGTITAFDCDEGFQNMIESAFRIGDDSRTYNLARQPWHLEVNRVNNSTVVCRRSAIDAGDFPDQLVFQAEDWYLWLRVARTGDFHYDPLPLTRYRCHADSFTSRVFSRGAALQLSHLEVLATLYAKADTQEQTRLASAMLSQLNHLVIKRAELAGIQGTEGSRRLVRSFLKAIGKLFAEKVCAMTGLRRP